MLEQHIMLIPPPSFHVGIHQGSEKWIAQIAALLDKMPSVRQISFCKYGTIPQNTYNLGSVQDPLFKCLTPDVCQRGKMEVGLALYVVPTYMFCYLDQLAI